ncbi:MAG: hypothetical protein JXM73_01590 [Anaerolineae bacterium]|nr:hypothetical protein [Anaerolineae bacterium]
MTQPGSDCGPEVERILASDLPDLEKVVGAFDCITQFVIGHAEAEIELARAIQDHEQVIKTQIKKETMAHARSILAHCYLRATGRRPWDERA